MHNAEKPNPPASVRDTGVRGVVGVVQHSSQKQPPRSRPTERTKRGSSWGESNLHAYWDDLLGTDTNPAAIDRLADEITKEHPAANFTAELAKRNIRDWAEENVEICLSTVYKNLDPNITRFFERPVGYEADAQRVARRRVALAGYRLAEELKRLFAEK